MRHQYIVKESNTIKREEFYDYITNTYQLALHYPYKKEAFINNKFPFVIDFKEQTFWVCESITCLACAQSKKLILTIDEFKKSN